MDHCAFVVMSGLSSRRKRKDSTQCCQYDSGHELLDYRWRRSKLSSKAPGSLREQSVSFQNVPFSCRLGTSNSSQALTSAGRYRAGFRTATIHDAVSPPAAAGALIEQQNPLHWSALLRSDRARVLMPSWVAV
jgi:hypothetical protein